MFSVITVKALRSDTKLDLKAYLFSLFLQKPQLLATLI